MQNGNAPFNSEARGVSANGFVVVGTSYSGLGSEAFIWDAQHGMRSIRSLLIENGLDMSGWILTHGMDISSDGRSFVGWGTNPDGLTEAWLVRVVPAPSSFVSFVGLAVTWLAFGCWRKWRR